MDREYMQISLLCFECSNFEMEVQYCTLYTALAYLFHIENTGLFSTDFNLHLICFCIVKVK
jgi:hypothetical protein